jgi:hypothetical protein
MIIPLAKAEGSYTYSLGVGGMLHLILGPLFCNVPTLGIYPTAFAYTDRSDMSCKVLDSSSTCLVGLVDGAITRIRCLPKGAVRGSTNSGYTLFQGLTMHKDLSS